MNVQTRVSGIGTTAQERAMARIRDALIKRAAELQLQLANSPIAGATPAAAPPNRAPAAAPPNRGGK